MLLNSVSKSSIALELEDLSFSLFAHNANAKKAFIPSQGKSPYMFFSFDDSFHLFVDEYKDTSLALCVDIDFAEDRTDVKNRGKENKIAFGFLTKDDFTSDGLLKTGTLVSRPMVTGFIDSADFQEGMSLSFSLPQDTKIKGFSYTQQKTCILKSKDTKAFSRLVICRGESFCLFCNGRDYSVKLSNGAK